MFINVFIENITISNCDKDVLYTYSEERSVIPDCMLQKMPCSSNNIDWRTHVLNIILVEINNIMIIFESVTILKNFGLATLK
jgi:hypothetical protein